MANIRQYKGMGIEFPEPQATGVPQGAGTAYARKYVRIPADVLRHQIIPAASDLAAQQLVAQNTPKGSRFQVYHALLRQYISLGIALYRQSGGLSKVTAQGILAQGSTNALPGGS